MTKNDLRSQARRPCYISEAQKRFGFWDAYFSIRVDSLHSRAVAFSAGTTMHPRSIVC